MSTWRTAETVISEKNLQCCALLRALLLEVECLSTAVLQSGTCDNQLSDRLLDSAKETCQIRASTEQGLGCACPIIPFFMGNYFQLMKFQTHILVFLGIARVN